MRSLVAALLLLPALAGLAGAHESRPAYLELRQTSAEGFDVLFKVPARGMLRLGVYARLPAECEETREPRGGIVGTAHIERWSVSHPTGLVGATIAIDGLRATQTDVLVRIQRLDGSVQVERLSPADPSMSVRGSPETSEVVATYLALGVRHILGGFDHLLFVLGLLHLVAGRWMLVKTITAFTVAHSITLAVATFGVVEAPAELVNALVALSILFLGPEIVRRQQGGTSLSIERPWCVAFGFGLLHGLGFASGLTELGLPRGEVPVALLSFNVGVEVGQLGFVALLIGVAASLRVLEVDTARLRRGPAYVVGGLGAYWTIGALVELV